MICCVPISAGVNGDLPDPVVLQPEFSQVDEHGFGSPSDVIKDETGFRAAGREIIRKIAAQTVNSADENRQKAQTWLVTDFITLGSPLTHAYYLMCDGKTETYLEKDFARRVTQREFPVCPPDTEKPAGSVSQTPKVRRGDGLLSFNNHGKIQFHHAALFGLTRWTNLYFPRVQLFWGDAVGGPLNSIFGRYIKDIPVSTLKSGAAAFFTHTSYWKITGPLARQSPQILILREIVNLEDKAV